MSSVFKSILVLLNITDHQEKKAVAVKTPRFSAQAIGNVISGFGSSEDESTLTGYSEFDS